MLNRTFILQIITQLLFGMLGALCLQCSNIMGTQKVVTVDITGIVKSFEDELLKQKISSDDASRKIQQFGNALNSTMLDYADKKHVILLPKQAVITGDIDKTTEIKELIKNRIVQ